MLKVLIAFLWLTADPFKGWDTLQMLTLKKSYDDLLGEETEVPVFSESLKAFEGKQVTIEGYVIPLQQSGAQDYFVLSRFPYNNCFFCGNAGPETVAEIYTLEKISYRDARVRVKGILHLNADNPLHLFFIIRDSEVVRLD